LYRLHYPIFNKLLANGLTMQFWNIMYQLGSRGYHAVIRESDVAKVKNWHHCSWYEISCLIMSQIFSQLLWFVNLWSKDKPKTTKDCEVRHHLPHCIYNLWPDMTLLWDTNLHSKVWDMTWQHCTKCKTAGMCSQWPENWRFVACRKV